MHNLRVLGILPLFFLAACATQSDVDYCDRMGAGRNTEQFSPCIRYFYEQQALFDADRAVCSAQADQTYPQSLYDHGSYGILRGGFGYGGFGNVGYGAPFFNSRMVDIPPNYQHNSQVDSLRMRIIEPCMQARGWNSGSSWEAGRSQAPSKAATALPKNYTPSPSATQAGAFPWQTP